MRATLINDELFFAYQDVSTFLFGKVTWAPAYSVSWAHRAVVMVPTNQPVLKRCSMINAAGIRALCEKEGKEHMLEALFEAETVDPFRQSDADRCIEELRASANEVLSAFFRDEGEDRLRDAMKRLQSAVGRQP